MRHTHSHSDESRHEARVTIDSIMYRSPTHILSNTYAKDIDRNLDFSRKEEKISCCYHFHDPSKSVIWEFQGRT